MNPEGYIHRVRSFRPQTWDSPRQGSSTPSFLPQSWSCYSLSPCWSPPPVLDSVRIGTQSDSSLYLQHWSGCLTQKIHTHAFQMHVGSVSNNALHCRSLIIQFVKNGGWIHESVAWESRLRKKVSSGLTSWDLWFLVPFTYVWILTV